MTCLKFLLKIKLTIHNSSEHDVALIMKRMNQVNPVYIPRNHKVDIVLKEAFQENNLEPFEELLTLLLNPYKEVEGKEDFASPPPAGTPRCVTFCGT